PWLVSHQHLTVGQVVGGVIYLFSGLQPAIQILVNAGGTILVSFGVVLARLAETSAGNALAERHGTLVVIAHWISSAMCADRILVMDGADTILGGHRDLLASSSLYADLVGYRDHAMAPDWRAEQAFQPAARHRGSVG
ncbi:MAG: hypothetical protein JO268_03440, partial [Pseudonocardiales bacterium]|nr:hypothetical protein [Pseudonocardiales bacterium]